MERTINGGNSDQENHQDFVDLVLQENPYLNTVQTDKHRD